MTDIKELISKLHKAQESKNKEKEIKILFEIANFYYENEEFEKSKLNFKKILMINPKQIEINYHLALIELQNENYNQVSKYLKKELENNPNCEKAKKILEKIEINSNLPLITITVLILNSIIFYFTFPKISLIELIKYSLNYNNLNILSTITSLFFHANIYHFGINMIILLMFGFILEKQIGSIKFLIIYLISGICANFIQSYLIQKSFVLGASGAIFGIIGSLIMIKPLLSVRLFGIFKMPLIIVFGAFFIFSNMINDIISKNIQIISGDIAHITGFLIGLLITGTLYNETIKVFYNWLLISIGFYLINLCITLILTSNLFQLINILLIILYFTTSTILIGFSYKLLKLREVNLE